MKPIQEMTPQEVFDHVVSHLRQQGKQAMDERGIGCLYRAPDGGKCAAGCLMTDEIYEARFEQQLVASVPELRHYFGDHLGLVARLQGVHDDGVKQWEKELFIVAQQFSLRYTAPAA